MSVNPITDQAKASDDAETLLEINNLQNTSRYSPVC